MPRLIPASGNGLLPVWHQAIILTKADSSVGPLGNKLRWIFNRYYTQICFQRNGNCHLQNFRHFVPVLWVTLCLSHTRVPVSLKQVSRAWISNYIPQFLWGVITYPCPRYLLLLAACMWCEAVIFVAVLSNKHQTSWQKYLLVWLFFLIVLYHSLSLTCRMNPLSLAGIMINQWSCSWLVKTMTAQWPVSSSVPSYHNQSWYIVSYIFSYELEQNQNHNVNIFFFWWMHLNTRKARSIHFCSGFKDWKY